MRFDFRLGKRYSHSMESRHDRTLRARWTHEATRLHERYQVEVVEACGLCPWAERARVGGAFRAQVLLQTSGVDTESALAAIDDFTADSRVEVAVLIYPRLQIERLEFDRFLAAVRDADTPRHQLGTIPFVFAAFHPDAKADPSDPERLIPFLRRTPDPTIQLLRSSVLERVRSGSPQGTQFFDMRSFHDDAPLRTAIPLRQRIATANSVTVERLGVAELARRFDAIALDRTTTYAALAEGASDESLSQLSPLSRAGE